MIVRRIIVGAFLAALALAAAWRVQSATARAPTAAGANDAGPDVVIMDELVDLYEPVPFDHRSHAEMAQMWDGCVTCHHRTPEPTQQAPGNGKHTQEESAAIPACKSCHAADAAEATISMPSLKGAYHRQCLNCHREWAHANACGACHQPRAGRGQEAAVPTRDDIVGRMHPPIPAPETKPYRMRFTPADGPNVLFRHKDHTERYGLKCNQCHRRDNCANCHDAGNGDGKGGTARQPMLRPGLTWEQSHDPCMNCHREDRCRHCHYADDRSPPPAFEHARTGQWLDKDHESLTCGQCHTAVKRDPAVTCGDAACHKDVAITYPARRPGPVLATPPPPAARSRPLPGTLVGTPDQ